MSDHGFRCFEHQGMPQQICKYCDLLKARDTTLFLRSKLHEYNMFRPGSRDYSTVNVFHGESDDEQSMQMPLDFIPRVGDIIDVWSSRDERGNYYGLSEPGRLSSRVMTRNTVKGKVVRVEHTIEERGESSQEHSWVQFVNIYTEPLPLTNDGKPN